MSRNCPKCGKSLALVGRSHNCVPSIDRKEIEARLRAEQVKTVHVTVDDEGLAAMAKLKEKRDGAARGGGKAGRGSKTKPVSGRRVDRGIRPSGTASGGDDRVGTGGAGKGQLPRKRGRPPGPETILVNFRFSPELVVRLDRARKAGETRTAALVRLLEEGLGR